MALPYRVVPFGVLQEKHVGYILPVQPLSENVRPVIDRRPANRAEGKRSLSRVDGDRKFVQI